jgi:hypothetical protein
LCADIYFFFFASGKSKSNLASLRASKVHIRILSHKGQPFKVKHTQKFLRYIFEYPSHKRKEKGYYTLRSFSPPRSSCDNLPSYTS